RCFIVKVGFGGGGGGINADDGQRVFRDVLAGRAFGYDVDRAADRADRSAEHRATDNVRHRLDRVARQFAVDRADHGQMVQRVDNVDNVRKRVFVAAAAVRVFDVGQGGGVVQLAGGSIG